MAGAASLSGVPPAGMVLGYDRHGIPVVARVFRPTGTRIVVVGGLRTAQVLALRALAVGARIDVRTRRWAAWHEFAEEIAAVDTMTVTPDAGPLQRWTHPHDETWQETNAITGRLPGSHPGAPVTPFKPRLTIVDVATQGIQTGCEAAVVTDTAERTPLDAEQRSTVGRQSDPDSGSPARPTAAGDRAGNRAAAQAAPGPAREQTADGRPSVGRGGGAAQRTTVVGRGSMRRHVLEVGGEDDLVADLATATRTTRAAPDPAARWHAVVTVRDELTEADVGSLAAADLVDAADASTRGSGDRGRRARVGRRRGLADPHPRRDGGAGQRRWAALGGPGDHAGRAVGDRSGYALGRAGNTERRRCVAARDQAGKLTARGRLAAISMALCRAWVS